jgi:predicted HicB family RNase H-like nuclease
VISLIKSILNGRFPGLVLNLMKHRGYTARIDYVANDHLFVGRVLGMSEQLVFHGASVDELRADFEFAVDHYLSECKKEGIPPEKPASGKLLLRLPPEVHAAAAVAAESVGKSLNQWVAEAVEKAASK